MQVRKRAQQVFGCLAVPDADFGSNKFIAGARLQGIDDRLSPMEFQRYFMLAETEPLALPNPSPLLAEVDRVFGPRAKHELIVGSVPVSFELGCTQPDGPV
jgi:hypothetical protein